MGVKWIGLIAAVAMIASPSSADAQKKKTKPRAKRPAATRPVQRDVYYPNCAAARAAGAAPIRRGQPGYSHKLDRDDDGVACE